MGMDHLEVRRQIKSWWDNMGAGQCVCVALLNFYGSLLLLVVSRRAHVCEYRVSSQSAIVFSNVCGGFATSSFTKDCPSDQIWTVSRHPLWIMLAI